MALPLRQALDVEPRGAAGGGNGSGSDVNGPAVAPAFTGLKIAPFVAPLERQLAPGGVVEPVSASLSREGGAPPPSKVVPVTSLTFAGTADSRALGTAPVAAALQPSTMASYPSVASGTSASTIRNSSGSNNSNNSKSSNVAAAKVVPAALPGNGVASERPTSGAGGGGGDVDGKEADDEADPGPPSSSAYQPTEAAFLAWTLDERLSILNYVSDFAGDVMKGARPMTAMQLLVGPDGGTGVVAGRVGPLWDTGDNGVAMCSQTSDCAW